MVSDDKIKSGAGGALGCAPDVLAIVKWRTNGANTCVALKGHDGREFNCIISGRRPAADGHDQPSVLGKER